MRGGRVKSRSASQYSFAQIPKANIPRSSFQRNHTHKTTFDAGLLIPIYVDEVLPGDTFNLHVDLFGRIATPIFPIMDGIYVETFFFFVPNRLLWDNWKKFCGEQVNPGDSTDFTIPQLVESAAGDHLAGGLGDYFGIRTATAGLHVNALPFRAYNLIYNEWFRDENLINSVTVPTGNGPDAANLFTIRRRGKRHDYFTSCLPWPQKGAGVELPLSGNAPVIGATPFASMNIKTSTSATGKMTMDSGAHQTIGLTHAGGTASADLGFTPGAAQGLIADLSDVTAATINSLRVAFQLEKLMERDARGGTRYAEILRSHFGVVSADASLQRPEYLGGGQSPLLVNPVTQTSETGATSPQGNLSAYGVVGGGQHGFVKSFTEHGYIIGLVTARADLSYQQGLHRMWSRSTKYDFYWPAFAHLGEQAVLNKEIFAQGTAADEEVFGYQEHWAEYKYGVSKITGQFRSDHATPLDAWHLAQDFAVLPTLGQTFIEEDPPVDRCIAVPSEPHFILDTFFQVNTVRVMPVYSVPGLIDHF